MDTNQKEKKKKTVGREILEWILTIAAAVLIAMVIRTFIFEPVRVEGTSMDNTLADGEIMFVTKYDYIAGDPQRFDVVICRYPGRGSTNFVKRVVGLPGDTVELKDGYLYVNGEPYEEPYISDEYRRGWQSDFGPFTDPEGQYLVMGDHRNNSNDSRSQGALSRSMIIGHARSVLFPFGSARGIE